VPRASLILTKMEHDKPPFKSSVFTKNGMGPLKATRGELWEFYDIANILSMQATVGGVEDYFKYANE